MGGLFWGDTGYGRHIPKIPVMLTHPIADRHVHGKVCMVFTPIHLAYKWGALGTALCVVAVT